MKIDIMRAPGWGFQLIRQENGLWLQVDDDPCMEDTQPANTPYLPEINEECEYSLGGPYYPCTICYRYTDYRGEHFIIGCPHLDNEKQHVSVESETQPVFFRPKKSDRELWVKAAEKVNKAHFWTQTEFLVALYDAMQSGELPVPEVK